MRNKKVIGKDYENGLKFSNTFGLKQNERLLLPVLKIRCLIVG